MIGEIVKHKVLVPLNDEAQKLKEELYIGKEIGNYWVLSLIEALYLYEKGILKKLILNGKEISKEEFINYAKNYEYRFEVKYKVYKDLREKDCYVGTGYKFGSEFRVYERGQKPIKGKVHSKWVCYPVKPEDRFTLYEFSAKMRVAHSTRKKLLIAIVKDNVRYIEISWKKL